MIKRRGQYPMFTWEHARVLGGVVPAVVCLPFAVWLFFSFFSFGDPSPLYIPLLNPLELQQALCLTTFALWQRTISQAGGIRFALPRLRLTLDILLFLWLHSMLFRAIAHFAGLPMSLAWEHESFQALLTAFWGVWGMLHLILGNRKQIRPLWAAGAALIIVDTAKLFLIDLADRDTLFRVISFFVLGGIFMLIGWLAPLPRCGKTDNEAMDSPEAPLPPPEENNQRDEEHAQ
jgi:uncharacterized membrane protein